MKSTIGQLLDWSSEYMPRPEAILLLAAAIDESPQLLEECLKTKVPERFEKVFRKYVQKRLIGVPLPYVVGFSLFCRLPFFVEKGMFVPRISTEIMVAAVEKEMNGHDNITLVDIGTGCGAIPIVLAKKQVNPKKTLASKQGIKSFAAYGVDVSLQAVRVADKNASHHKVPVTFLHGNFFVPVSDLSLVPDQYLIITAHLPYLTIEEYSKAREEPDTTLLGGGHDGLKLYREFFVQLQELKHRLPNKWTMFVECHPDQMPGMQMMVEHFFSGAKTSLIYNDENIARVMKVVQS